MPSVVRVPDRITTGDFADVTIPSAGVTGYAFVWNHATQMAVWTQVESAGAAAAAVATHVALANPHGQYMRVADIRAYGATGDGVTDDTAAIQAALNASRSVYVPSGTYITSNLTIALDGTRIFGDGVTSILQFKDASTGALLSSGARRVELESLNFYGGSDTSRKGTATSTANRSAVSVESQRNSQFRNLTIHGFENYGVTISDASRDRLSHLVISDTTIYYCWMAIQAGPINAEYIRFSNLDCHNNYYALYLSSGNITVSNSKINDNGYGVYVLGTAIGNNAHGNVNGCMINHSTVYSIYCKDVTNGFNFIANNIFDGDIYLDTSTGINIASGIFDVAAIYLKGGARNVIRSNFVKNDYTNTVNHNVGGSADATLLADNYLSSGAWSGNNAATGDLAADGTVAGATAQAQQFTTGVKTGKISVITDGANALGLYRANGTTQDVWYDSSNGRFSIGVLPSQAKFEVAAGTISSSLLSAVWVSATLSGTGIGEQHLIISSGSTGSQYAARFRLDAGYTGAGTTGALEIYNSTAGTGTNLNLATAFVAPTANLGFVAYCWQTTAGSHIAAYGDASGGNVNIGSAGKAVGAKASAKNIGVMGIALNTNATSPIHIGGFFGQQTTQATVLSESAALIADNGTQTTPIFLARDNGATVFCILDGGNVGIGQSSATALLDLAASTATRASLRIRPGAFPIGANRQDGDIGYVTSGRLMMYRGSTEEIVATGVQATGGAATAGASYTATEQAMLQKVYDAARAFGQLS